MMDIEQKKELIGFREHIGNMYGRKKTELPKGISVCVTDYTAYKEHSKYVDTIPIFINRHIKFRFEKCSIVGKINQEQFLDRDKFDLKQFHKIKADKDVIKIRHNGELGMKLQLDEIMFPYFKRIKKTNILRAMFDEKKDK